ncbi:ABC-2 type transport system ATP-binding protein [Actinoplanes tereljensis]|uniref:Multidrug ABC transporter ATP-binding protein n=1 Tax=Paractinoplanes tereljensis TaxID=571912 RepID=A0A919NPE6_9ACTN|nr:ABC transporter ATP-binding protein [Actinoplanes tereljensis]GIF22253.1 multidrug ABC transporter ATP-binding protein [Actinoplanes tereljensis]
MTTDIQVTGLHMRYGHTDALHDITFTAHRGDILALLGPNGAGKTTTIEILEGFRTRTAGHVTVLGTDPAHADEHWRAHLGVVRQTWRDHGKWRPRELLTQIRAHYTTGWNPDDLLTAVGLDNQTNQPIRTLSGGQRRRLDLALGIIGHPRVLFLDEPTAGLDPAARHDFHHLIRGLADTTVLLTTHDLDEAQKLATRLLVLDHGRLLADGTPTELTGHDEVRWTLHGTRHTQPTDHPARLIHDLYRDHGDHLHDVDIHHASLEDTYLALTR